MDAEKKAILLPGKEKTSEGNENCLHIFKDNFVEELLILELGCEVMKYQIRSN